VPSSASTVAISWVERPVWRNSMIRARAASLAGAVFGPGLGVRKNSQRPARKSRTSDCNAAVV
jgi:hypothetical protein